jgi:glutathione-regulated potassium-efflux system ancillary protein KefG
MKNILVLFAHPAFHKSRINKTLINAVKNIEGITVHNLYEHYPDFFIDVRTEQKLLLKHDIIVWHHPFYWYSAPAMIKEWMDLVLEHGFAYGMKGRALEGKWVLSAISTGGRKEVYSKTGGNRFTINQFLAPYNQSANLCRMKYLPPFVVHGSHTLSEAELQKAAQDYKQLLTGLRDDKFTESTFAKAEYLNNIIEQNA